MKLKYYFLSARPKVLFIGLGPAIVGVFLSLDSFSTSNLSSVLFYGLSAALLTSVLCIQTACHFFNDVYDFLKGADTSSRKGPKRMIQQALLSVKELKKAGFICLSLAAFSGAFLVWQGGLPILAIGLAGLILAYVYTGGPWSLAYTGLADLFAVLFFGVLACMGAVYLYTGEWSLRAFTAGTQLGLLALSLLTVNNLRDEKEDKRAGKKTLIVRLGRRFGLWEWSLSHFLPYIIGLYWLKENKIFMFALPLLLLPLSFYLQFLIIKAFDKEFYFHKSLIFTCLYHFLFTVLLAVGIFC